MKFKIETLEKIINDFGLETPLDGDDVDELVEILRDQLNEYQGNEDGSEVLILPLVQR